MSRNETLMFLNAAHFFDHLFLLIFPTAAIAIAALAHFRSGSYKEKKARAHTHQLYEAAKARFGEGGQRSQVRVKLLREVADRWLRLEVELPRQRGFDGAMAPKTIQRHRTHLEFVHSARATAHLREPRTWPVAPT